MVPRTVSAIQTLYIYLAELGTLLFEIAQSLFALERTLILGAMALLNKNERTDKIKF